MLRRSDSHVSRVLGVVGATTMLMLVLASCGPTPSPDPVRSPAVESPGATEEPAGPSYVPDGTADDNLPLFSAIVAQVWASDQRASGRAYIDALIGAGFDRSAMQVTQDSTTVGNPAESLQFSVRWGEEECLVGQVGPSTGDPVTVVLPQLAEGRCLIGTTRAIDW
ncbi:DUF6993 domain-containing protein [Microbacterium foliorum]|uniref:DUF6993 domain-containing protein n=1 Tax=Microbacterium foliorum TaxID=104336 RepID=UPI0028D05C0A|nr:hypothetical protein [Microbacterium foliorum]